MLEADVEGEVLHDASVGAREVDDFHEDVEVAVVSTFTTRSRTEEGDGGDTLPEARAHALRKRPQRLFLLSREP